jgi:hypothetical protein
MRFGGRVRLGAFGALVAALLTIAPLAGRTRDTLPAELSDGDFWSLTESLSEPSLPFRSFSGSTDNLLSNE